MPVGFYAMGTEITVVTPGLSQRAECAAADRVADVFARAEDLYSRFRDESELSRLNASTTPMVVSTELYAMLDRARAYVRATGGIFDPGIGAALRALGYDRSFAPNALDRDTLCAAVTRPSSLADLGMNPSSRTVTRPVDLHIDLGGIVKGATVDACRSVLPTNSALDAGGDARLSGGGPEANGWDVDIESPTDPELTIWTLTVTDTAIATSNGHRRRWRVGNSTAHHLVNPRTGQSAVTDLVQVTVLAPTAEQADVWAKCAYILGRRAAHPWLRAQAHIRALLVDDHGGLHPVGDLPGHAV